jgi:chromosomal replication initiator protein
VETELTGENVATLGGESAAAVEFVETGLIEQRSGQWARVRGRLRAEFGDGVFRSWLRPMTLVATDSGSVTISVPTRFMRDRVNALYGDRLRALWATEDEAVAAVNVVVGAGEAAKPLTRLREPVRPAPAAPHPAPAAEPDCARGDGQDDWLDGIGAPLDARFTFDNFVVGRPNEFAHAACRRVAEATAVPFNPLFLYGGVGLGKTHLMHAIAWHIKALHPWKRVLYLSAEKFMYQFIRAVRYRDTVAFKDQFRSVDVLMVDDVQFICGRESTQEEFFHTFNALVDQNRQIVISADKSPSDLEGLEDRMRSRLGWGLVADLHPTNYELRLSILESKAEQSGATVPKPVLEYLAARITSSVRELEGALNRLVAHAQLIGRELTVETVQDVLRDLLRANERRVTIEEIQKRVAEHFNIRLSDMHSPRRARAVARPRQVAMYLAKQLTSRSLPEIGRKFGGRDHTTVMHAVRKIDELRATDASLSEDVDLLRRMLEK